MKRQELDGYKKKDEQGISYRTSEYKGKGRPKKSDYVRMVRDLENEHEYQVE